MHFLRKTLDKDMENSNGERTRAKKNEDDEKFGGKKEEEQQKGEINKKTYNTGDSLVVTDPTTSPAVSSLSRGERTGSRVLYCVWSYVSGDTYKLAYISSITIYRHGFMRKWLIYGLSWPTWSPE